MSFQVEHIPDEDSLFKWVPRSKFDDAGYPDPVVFTPKGKGLSSSWSKYSTAAKCRARLNRPETIGVVGLPVGKVRELALVVKHSPREDDQAHADVVGAEDAEARVKLARLAFPAVISPDPKKTTAARGARGR